MLTLKFKSTLSMLAVASGILLGGALAGARADALSEAAGQYRINASSHIAFSVGQVGGGGISGDFSSFRGTFRIDGSDIGRSTVQFTLVPASVRTGEPRTENFLRSDAVFDVANFPEITFKSTRVTRTGDNSARIDGVLTARGKSRKAVFVADVGSRTKSAINFHVRGKILRSLYDMDVGTPIYSNVVDFDMNLQGSRT
jgi:polyisoprenoid-binding protein YceI